MKTVDIIIFGGQSNMQGQTEILSECEEVKGAYEYKLLTDSLVPLKNPAGEDIRYDGTAGERPEIESSSKVWLANHVLGSACYGNTNMLPSFSRAYIKETNKEVIAVHAAKGSTKIAEWLPGTAGYKMLVKKALSAIEKAKETYEVGGIYFVWLQGESDALSHCGRVAYKERLSLLGHSLQKDIGLTRFGIIRVGRFACDERDLEIISAQSEICREDSLFLMLTEIATELNEQPEYMNPFVRGHFSAKGQEKLGEVAGQSLGEAVNNK